MRKYRILEHIEKLDRDERQQARRALEYILQVGYVQVSRTINAKEGEPLSISIDNMARIRDYLNYNFSKKLGLLSLDDLLNQQPERDRA